MAKRETTKICQLLLREKEVGYDQEKTRRCHVQKEKTSTVFVLKSLLVKETWRQNYR